MLDIEPVHINSCDCYEDLIITLAYWINRPYHFIFASSWGFSFEDKNLDFSSPIGKKISSDEEEIINKIVEQFIGIRITFNQMDSFENTIDRIKAKLSMNLPVIISIDSYWIPWDPEYQKNHYKYHTCLAVGINDTDQSLVCTDPFWSLKKNVQLPINDYKYGFGPCRTIDILEAVDINEIDYIEVLRERLARLNLKINGLNCFESINIFADYINNSDNLCSEFSGYGMVWNSPLVFKLNGIINGRRKFSKFLQYVSQKEDNNSLQVFSDDLELVASKWDTVKSLLVKGSFTGFNERVKSKLSNIIRDIAKHEEIVASGLNEFVESPMRTKTSYIKPVKKNLEKDSTSKEHIYVNLSKYFNNKGFGSTISSDCCADLTGTGEYFLTEGLPKDEIWYVKDYSFIFPSVEDMKGDNISCSEQQIIIPKGIYESVTILGCSEFGNSSGSITLQSDTEQEETITVSISDWALNPMFDEIIAWRGKAVRKEGKTLELMTKFEFKLYAKQYLLKSRTEVSSLRLPYCPNMHIFAITLSKISEV